MLKKANLKQKNERKLSVKVYFLALPYITAQLHLGRLMSTFLPADIMKRYNKKFLKVKTFLISGLDCHGTSVFQQLKKKKIDFKTYLRDKKKSFFETLKNLGVTLYYNFDTSEKRHRKYVNRHIEELILEKKIVSKNTQEYFCKACNSYLADRLLETKEGISLEVLLENQYQKSLINKESTEILFCSDCKKEVERKNLNGLFLKYEDEFKYLEELKQISRPLEWGLKPNAKILKFNNGVKFSYYVWIQALLSYSQQYERLNRYYNIEEIKYFYGKDNKYYHQIVFLNLLKKEIKFLGSNNQNSYVRNYILDKDNKKISSSKLNFITLEDLEVESKEIIRFSLAMEDCLSKDSSITTQKLKDNCMIYIKKFVNGCNRIINVFKKISGVFTKKEIKPVTMTLQESDYHKHIQNSNLKKTAEQLIKIQSTISAELDSKIKSKDKDFNSCYYKTLRFLELLYPFTPKIANKLKNNLKHFKMTKYDLKKLKIY